MAGTSLLKALLTSLMKRQAFDGFKTLLFKTAWDPEVAFHAFELIFKAFPGSSSLIIERVLQWEPEQ